MKEVCKNYNKISSNCITCKTSVCEQFNCFLPITVNNVLEEAIYLTNKQVKPPIGLIPKYISDRNRAIEIKMAVNRYFEVDKQIPIEWIEEYNELKSIKK